MAKQYKVWIHLEEIDEEADTFEDVTEPIDVGGYFDTEEEAQNLIDKLVTLADEDDEGRPHDPGCAMHVSPAAECTCTKANPPVTVRHTTCKHCEQDIEGMTPFAAGQWRDRGNNTTCPAPMTDGRKHEPVPE